MFGGLFDLLFPRACAACGERPAPGPFCSDCSVRLEVPPLWRCTCCAGPLPLPSAMRGLAAVPGERPGRCADCDDATPFVSVRTAFTHGGAAAEAVHRLKYRGRREVARTIAPLLATVALADRARIDVVAPIPLHAARRRLRGYDQAGLVALELARFLDLPLRPGLLVRTRPTDQQVGLDRAERQRNLAGAFQATPAAKGLRVAVVDDVITTGATARAAAQALLDAGALEVRVLALARAGH